MYKFMFAPSGLFNFFCPNVLGLYIVNSTVMPLLSGPINPQTWQNIVITKFGSTWSLYINNILISSATSSVSMDGGISGYFYIGSSGAIIGSSVVNNYYTGKISNVFIYNRSLSAGELIQNYNSLKSRYGY